MREKYPHGYRRRRNTDPPLPDPPKVDDLRETLLGSDQLARLVREAAALAPLPEPEDLLVMWARAYYEDPETRAHFIYQIGLYVAEDLRLNGRLDR